MDDGQSIRKVLTGIHRHEPVDIGLQRRHALVVEACGIKTHCIEVGDLLIYSARICLCLCDVGEKVIQTHLVGLTKLVERTVARKLRLERVCSLPAACSVLIEVILERYGLIKVRTVDCRHFLSLLHIASCHKCNS